MHQSQTFQSFKAHPLMLAMAILLPSFASAETSTSSSTVALPTISLKAQGDQSSVTEGTQSYTAKSANTATKLSLSLRETPQSVKVLTREYLDDANISSFQDLLNNVTGVSVNQWDERQYPTARGFDVDYYLFDGVPSNVGMEANDPDLTMYDRVELVKGANGLMTGAGNPAIAINMIRKHANAKELTGQVSTSLGSWNAWTSSADISTPLNTDGTVRGRVVVKHEDTDSFMKGYEKNNNVVYGVVDADISDKTYVSVGAGYQNLERDGVRWGGLPAFDSNGQRVDFDRSKTVTSDWTYWNTDTTTAFATLKQNLFNDVNLHVNYAYREVKQDTALLYLWGSFDKTTNTSKGTLMTWSDATKTKENNIDTYLSAPFSIGGLEQEIVAGFMYNQAQKDTWYSGNPQIASDAVLDFDHPNVPLLASIQNNNIYQVPNKTTQTGAYLAGKFSLAEPLKLITGIRLSNWKYESDDGVGNRKFKNEVTPYAGLVFDFLDQYSWYASYTSIFKPEDKRDINKQYLDPREGKSYETGLKGEFLNGKLNAALSVFQTKQDNVAEETGTFIPSPDGTPTTEKAYRSADGVESKGVEFELDGEIANNWNLSFGIAHFNAKDAQGNEVQTMSSRTNANLFTKYKLDKWSVGGGVNYKSKFYTGEGDKRITQDAYALANLMLGYDIDSNIKAQINLNNIFDKKYYTGIGDNLMVYGAPRNVTFTLRYQF